MLNAYAHCSSIWLMHMHNIVMHNSLNGYAQSSSICLMLMINVAICKVVYV